MKESLLCLKVKTTTHWISYFNIPLKYHLFYQGNYCSDDVDI